MNRKAGFLLILSLIILAAAPAKVMADVKYPTYTLNSYSDLVYMQPVYYPDSVYGNDLTVQDPDHPDKTLPSKLQGPKDIFIDKKDDIYIADTGNNRIIQLNAGGELARYITIPDSPLNNPEGVFVTDTGDIYVADTGNQRVIKLDADGQLVKEYGRPESRYIPESLKYDPVKLIVDKRGFLYIATNGGYQGLLQLDPDGEFQSFYGANDARFTVMDGIKRALYSKEMYANEISKLPGSINSVTTDEEGFIYTVSGGDIEKNQLRKLNTRGDNLLTAESEFGKTSDGSYGEYLISEVKKAEQKVQLIDTAVDRSGNMAVIDQQFKYISHYDSTGNLLYFWGGPAPTSSNQLGLLQSPRALDFNSRGELFVLDDQMNLIQGFRLTEFGSLVSAANQLTLNGRYEESEKPWREVLRQNAGFTPAVFGLAKAAYKKGQYEEAKELFRQAGSQEGYSDSFWQIRLVWFQKNFSRLVMLFLIVTALYVGVTKWAARGKKRKSSQPLHAEKRTFLTELKHAFYLLRHPIDGFTAIRYESKASYLGAGIVLACAIVSLIANEYMTSFSFNKIVVREIDVISIMLRFLLIWFGWVLANYLISSIYRGEGRFRDVFIGSSYCLLPVILIGLPLAILSNGMTMSEASIYGFFDKGMLLWIGLLFFWQIQSIHNYSVGETSINILLSAFTLIMIAVMVYVIGGLGGDLLSFIREIYLEVSLR